jgi:hypothetical protein
MPGQCLDCRGGNHDKFTNPNREGVLIIVPRHRVVSPGVARDNRGKGRLDMRGEGDG